MFNYSQTNLKNLVILLTELVAVFLMALGIMPRELSLLITGLMIFYFLFSPLDDSLWVFLASLPLFVALPLTTDFDSMANWRILLALLFLLSLKSVFKTKFSWRKIFQLEQTEWLAVIFLILGAASLLVADNKIIGLKKLLFLINIGLLYLIIKKLLIENKELLPKIISGLKTAIGLTLGIGWLQFLMVFRMPLYNFWQFWAHRVIPVFYGHQLSELLATSNSWFSYYAYLPPTLRIFSVFPDSHSFAFFCILSLPFILTLIFLRSQRGLTYYLILAACFLAIIFSGSRGAWISALVVLWFLILLRIGFWSPTLKIKTHIFQDRSRDWLRALWLMIGSLLIFFLLFPIGSGLLLLSQKAQPDQIAELTDFSFFERAKSILNLNETSAKSRLEIWQRSLDSFFSHPISGIGLGNFPLIINEDISAAKKGASAHNFYLEIAAEMGVFALLIILAFFCLIFQKIWKLFQTPAGTEDKDKQWLKYWSGFFALVLLWILGYSFFDVVLFNDKVLLFFTANLAIIMTCPGRKKEK